MYFKSLLTALLCLFLLPQAFTQQQEISQTIDEIFGSRGEIYFRFDAESDDLVTLSRIISIDQVKGKTVFAYANKNEFEGFLKEELAFELLPKPGELIKNPKMLDQVNVREITEWDFYPTYTAYLDMMNQYATDYPALCEVFSIGQSVQGRQLMMAKISKNVSTREAEPQFLYTGTIHGDETTGYVLLLRLIDYLLESYGTDPKVTYLLDNAEIWINPASNPDGTYHGGNNTVNGAQRYNANDIDLNRNYPDPEDGPHPDGNAWQPETIAFMQLAEDNHFVMSGNTHGGEEVLNYPWDTWATLHADDDWWIYVCRQYVDTVHLYSPANYMNEFDNGITNGYAWYTISGGRQDYMNYFHNCRELTMEISDTKLLSPSQLPSHWNWNYRSLLNYLEQSTFGVNGIVTNLTTGLPLNAKITIQGHDMHNSFVFADPQTGFYQRLLEAGTYNLTFTAPGHYPVTIPNVFVSRYNTTVVNVQMDAGALAADFTASATAISVGGSVNFIDESFGAPITWQWQFPGGLPSTSQSQNPQNIVYSAAGSFPVTLTVIDGDGNQNTITKENFIMVNAEFLMNNQTITICAGNFYDSGGETGSYDDNENYIMTIKPETTGANIIVQFVSFDVEYQSSCNYDWLKIYNGTSTSSPLIGTYCGTNSPGTIEASNAQGALTFRFQSDNSVTKAGWKAIVSCSFVGLPPVAGFNADQTEVNIGETVYFTDLSANNPTSWQWVFEGGVPATSTAQNPVITYPAIGEYDVKLKVQNTYGVDSVLYENYIKVDSAIGITKVHSNGLNIYPNPVNIDLITITSATPVAEVAIYDLYGKVLIREEQSHTDSFQLSIAILQNGIYLIKVLDESGWKTSKVTVLR